MRSQRRSLWVLLTSVLLTLTLAPAAHARLDLFPDVIPLPNGWQPEGIAAGPGNTMLAGSRATGAVYQANVVTGQGRVVVEAPGPREEPRAALGMKYEDDVLYVAGGATGKAFFYNVRTGDDIIRPCVLVAAPTTSFINDVVVTKDAAYFTNSQAARLYRVPIRNDRPVCDPEVIELSGDWEQVPNAFNANGIDEWSVGNTLVVINSTLGALYAVDPESGVADEVELLGDATLTAGDGILVRGTQISVVRNRLNEIVQLRAVWDLSVARVSRTITDKDFDVPTTIAYFGPWLYTVNAKFRDPGVPSPSTYEIVKVDGR